MEAFAIRYGRFSGKLLGLLGHGRSLSGVELRGAELRVRMGYGFRARLPVAAVRSAAPDRARPLGIGVHGWRGDWLVNGSTRGIVRLQLAPEQRARVLGFPVRLRVLRVSLEQPEALLAALRARGA